MLDMNKRTPLHYAATLPDQGALYKVLIQAGADPNIKDGDGNTPGIYLRRKDLLTQADLFGMTRVKSRSHSTNNQQAQVDTWERPPSPEPTADPDESLVDADGDRMDSSRTPLVNGVDQNGK
jgi:ankyrin repeat protein